MEQKLMDPFQVTVLSDQVESQTEKITDLERVLDDKQGTLQKTEDVLARELLEKSALETARLGLLSEITDMRLRQVNRFSDMIHIICAKVIKVSFVIFEEVEI